MSAHGRSEALIPRAQREDCSINAPDRSEALIPRPQRVGSPISAPGRPRDSSLSARREAGPARRCRQAVARCAGGLHIAAGLLLAPTAVSANPDCPAQTWPAQVELEFDARASRSIFALTGEGRLRFARRGDTYEMHSSVSALGLFEARQQSVGVVKGAELVPQHFTQSTSRRPPRAVTLDWKAGEVRFGGDVEPEAIQPHTQDRLSMVFQVAARVRAEPRLAVLELPVASPGHVSAYRFVSHGIEPASVPAGAFDSIRLERRNEDNERFEIWLAPGLCGLPVRMRYSDDRGQVVDQQLRSVRFSAP
jgi:hypothetical protein